MYKRQVLGIESLTGQLKEGLQADMIVVEGNAAEDIAALNRLKVVFMGGKEVHRSEA